MDKAITIHKEVTKDDLVPNCPISLKGALPIAKASFQSAVTTPNGTSEYNLSHDSNVPRRRVQMWLAANHSILVIYQDKKFVFVPIENVQYCEPI